jgi:nucleoside-diphosphate-sugar epimerase
MRILLVGAAGAIGSAVEAALGQKHEIIRAGRSSGDVRIDITDEASIRINAVSAGIVAETKDKYAPLFDGFEPVSARRVAVAYTRSVQGGQTGQVYRVF